MHVEYAGIVWILLLPLFPIFHLLRKRQVFSWIWTAMAWSATDNKCFWWVSHLTNSVGSGRNLQIPLMHKSKQFFIASENLRSKWHGKAGEYIKMDVHFSLPNFLGKSIKYSRFLQNIDYLMPKNLTSQSLYLYSP